MAATIVPEALTGQSNYANWSGCMKNYFIAHDDIWDDVIERSGDPEEGEVEFKAWKKKNAAALHAIQISSSPDVFSQIRDVTSAKLCWGNLAQICKAESSIQADDDQVLEDDDQGSQESYIKAYDGQGTQGNELIKYRPLCKAIEAGDLDGVKSFLHLNEDAINQKITEYGSTALHLATSKGNIELVKELLEFMSNDGVEITNRGGHTALYVAAENGATKIAELLVKKNKKLVGIASLGANLPVNVAGDRGYKETTLYLYSQTPFELLLPQHGIYGASLLHQTLLQQIFEISLDLIQRCPSLATTTSHQNGSNPLLEFCRMHFTFPSGCDFVFWKRWIYSCIRVQLPTSCNHVAIPITVENDQMQQENCLGGVLYQFRTVVLRLLTFFGIRQIYELKLKHSYALALSQHFSEAISSMEENELEQRGVHTAFFDAIGLGIIEFVIAMSQANPVLIDVVDKNSRGIIHHAVRNRQEKIINYLYALGGRHYLLTSSDVFRNNLLHMAAMLAPPNRLAHISGAALQMQRELQWFKEVQSIMDHASPVVVNKEDFNPGELFKKDHKQLMIEGEKWMKETATSCTVVGALIITIMFTAAFTVPGGNIEGTGTPIFFNKKSFKVFIVSDAISLFASSTSVITFLGILTSRYAEDDFLESLPKKLIIGLSTLFISIAAMMVAFSATLIIMLDGNLSLITPSILLASIPVTLFLLLQLSPLVEIFISTYGSSILDTKMKHRS